MNLFSWWNLLWLPPMAGLIVLMYILKLRRKDVVVSSTFLWRQVIRDVQANAPFQKLRKNLLLFLQLLAVFLLVAALARPYWKSKGIGGRSIVIVVDNSASMSATDTGGSRLEEAKREAYKVIGDLRAEDQMMVLAAAAKPESLTGFTADRRELMRSVDGLKPRETSTNMRDAVNLAAALVASRDAAQIHIISDGAFPPITNVDLGKTHVAFHPIGKSGHNVGIAAVDYRRSLVGARSIEVLVTVHNFDTVKRTFNIELMNGGTTVDAHEVTLEAGKENPDVFELPEPAAPLTLDIRLDARDDLAVDNRAALVITPRQLVKALLVTNENVFLENSIQADPNVELSSVKPGGYTGQPGYDVVIFDGAAPKTVAAGNYLFVNCTSSQSPATSAGAEESQGIVDFNKSHPVLRYVEFGSNRWTSISHAKPAGWAQEIASGESGAAVVAGEKGAMRALWTGFNLDVAHGPFPLTVSYPIFVSNAIRWLGHVDESDSSQARTGQTLTLDAPASAGRVSVVKPDGTKRDLAVSPRGGVVFDDTDEVGIYTATGNGGFKRVFAANLASFAESDIAPKKNTDLGNNPPGRAGREVRVVRELWPWVAGILLALLCVEWWAFHRRVYLT